jgi:GTP cyclohydrolase II
VSAPQDNELESRAAHSSDFKMTSVGSTPERPRSGSDRLERLAKAPLPTRFGVFQMHVFRWDDPQAHPGLSNEHLALVMGDIVGERSVPVRVHSECLTSEVFGSLKCDCRQQLEQAQAEIADRGLGAILYLRQEGRGIGLANKIRAYALQELGADTIEANELLPLPVDARQNDVAAAMIRALGIGSVQLMTNNPLKLAGLSQLGIEVEQRIPVLVAANRYSAGYLEVKRRRMQHEIPSAVTHSVPGSDDEPSRADADAADAARAE